ncbi:MAG: GNAT family N-acetyltransferase [Roseimicrobium sp.]
MTTLTIDISHADTPAKLERCHPVVFQLRPHLSLTEFVARVLRQAHEGYRLMYAEIAGQVIAVAGYRIQETLAWGRLLYVDDLVTDEAWRSQQVGSALFDSLVHIAKENECRELHLDSGVQRFGAHRFYLAKRMDITCHHFAMKL